MSHSRDLGRRAWLSVSLLLAACGQPAGNASDAGPDASAADAEGRDASPPDAPPADFAPADSAPADAPPADAPPADAAGAWQLTSEFPGASNPNGPWTYAWASSLGGVLVVYPMLSTNPTLPTWYDPANNAAGTPAVWKNLTGATLYGVPDGMMTMHPGQSDEYAVVRFTAPAAATYSADVQFFDGDMGETDANVYVNGVSVFSAMTSANPSHSIAPRALAAGDTIELWVGALGSGAFDSTGVTFTVEAR